MGILMFAKLWIPIKTLSISGSSGVEFTSRDMRRLSHDFDGTESVVGYQLHSNETTAQFLFILDTQCSYEARISFDFLNTFTLVGL